MLPLDQRKSHAAPWSPSLSASLSLSTSLSQLIVWCVPVSVVSVLTVCVCVCGCVEDRERALIMFVFLNEESKLESSRGFLRSQDQVNIPILPQLLLYAHTCTPAHSSPLHTHTHTRLTPVTLDSKWHGPDKIIKLFTTPMWKQLLIKSLPHTHTHKHAHTHSLSG